MNYDNQTKPQLILILGEQSEKIETLLKQLEATTSDLEAFKNDPANWSKEYASIKVVLTNKISELNLSNEQLTTVAAELTSLKATESTNAELIKSLYDTNAGLAKQLDGAAEVITDLKIRLDQANEQVEAATDEVIISHGNKKYTAAIKRFSHEGVTYEAADLKSNKALVKQLIEEELGILKEKK